MRVLSVLLLSLCALLAVVSFASAELDPSWRDTEQTTSLWRVITSKDNEQLKKLLAEDESAAKVRAADGRGPLFWAHEAGNEEAIELLKNAGAEEHWTDADGKTCKEFEHGQMTEYMRKLSEDRARQEEEYRQKILQQQVEVEDDEDDEEEEKEEPEENEGDVE